jgi:DmsE family decaheme c-type cytochrome
MNSWIHFGFAVASTAHSGGRAARHRALAALGLAILTVSWPASTRPASAEDGKIRLEDVRAALAGAPPAPAGMKAEIQDAAYAELAEFARRTGERRGSPAIGPGAVRSDSSTRPDEAAATLLAFADQLPAAQPHASRAASTAPASGIDRDDAFSALSDFARQIGGEPAPMRVAKVVKPAPVKADPGEATYVGPQVCQGCHAVQHAAFNATLMGKVFRNPRNAQERLGCEGCHGPGSLHVKAGGGRGVGNMITFRLDDPRHTPEEYNAVCLSCHEKGNRTLWRGSTHETRGLTCTNCHTVMINVTPKAQLAKLTEMDTCFQCHKNKRAEIWRSSHMPVREGKMSCSTCHNPHGSYSEALLKETTVNDNCYKCHAEKRGPFLWEHAPVRENCLNCHDPHGSINDFLLKISRPRLCQQCHANLTGHPGNPRNPQSLYAINRECQNCHSQHHGSNSPAGSRFIR